MQQQYRIGDPVDFDPFAENGPPTGLDTRRADTFRIGEPVDFDPFAEEQEQEEDALLPAIGRGLGKGGLMLAQTGSELGTTFPGAAIKSAGTFAGNVVGLGDMIPDVDIEFGSSSPVSLRPRSDPRGPETKQAIDTAVDTHLGGTADALLRVGKENREFYGDIREDIDQGVPASRRGKDFIDDPGLLLNPAYLAEASVESIVSMVPPLVAAFTSGGSTLLAGGVGGAMEGLGALGEMIDDGMQPDEALVRSGGYTFVAGALNAYSFDKILSKQVVDGLIKKGAKILGAAGVEAFTEWLEGPIQALAQYTGTLPMVQEGSTVGQSAARGLEIARTPDKPQDMTSALTKAAREEAAVMPGAFFAGGGAAMIAPSRNAPTPSMPEKSGETRRKLENNEPVDILSTETANRPEAAQAEAAQEPAADADIQAKRQALMNAFADLQRQGQTQAAITDSPDQQIIEQQVGIGQVPARPAGYYEQPILGQEHVQEIEQGLQGQQPFGGLEMPRQESAASSLAAGNIPGQQAQGLPHGTASPVVAETVVQAQTPVDQKAHEAATSPLNDRPEPTEAQKEAGNYAKGHVSIGGMDISIENPAGSVRSGKDAQGREWQTEMKHHYGQMLGTKAVDGDLLDVFLGPDPDGAQTVFVVNQNDPITGKPDEHKAIIGAASEQEARDIYLANYGPGWQGLGSIVQMGMDGFKKWAKTEKTAQPAVGDVVSQPLETTPVDDQNQENLGDKGTAGTDAALPQAARREPWQMTGTEYASEAGKAYVQKRGGSAPAKAVDFVTSTAQKRHERIARQAAAEGKQIPAEVLAEYPDIEPPVDTASKPQRGKKPLVKKAVAERNAALSDYFMPGNIVKGYGGHDRVISFTPADRNGDGWNVTVQAVKLDDSGNWVDEGAARQRTHATMPGDKELKAGPVLRVESKPVQERKAQTLQEKPRAQQKTDFTEEINQIYRVLNLGPAAITMADDSNKYRSPKAEAMAMITAYKRQYGWSDKFARDVWQKASKDMLGPNAERVSTEPVRYTEAPSPEWVQINRDKTVEADMSESAKEKLTLKQQKAWLLAEIDKAIASGVKGGKPFEFHVPGDGHFRIKPENLATFKDAVVARFPEKERASALGKNPPRPATSASGRITEGEYLNPWQDTTTKIESVLEPSAGLFWDATNKVVADGHTFAIMPKKPLVKGLKDQDGRASAFLSDTPKLFTEDAVLVAQFKNPGLDNDTDTALQNASGKKKQQLMERNAYVSRVYALVEYQKGERQAVFPAQKVDALRTLYPNAKIKVEKDGTMLGFFEGKKLVGATMGIVGFEFSDYHLARIEEIKTAKEGLAPKVKAADDTKAEAPKQETQQPEPSKAQDKIKDFGEKIEGAKKDLWSGLREKMDAVADEEIASQPLSKIWPLPDYQALIDAGTDKAVVAYLRAMRDAIPTKPQKGWKLAQWVELTKGLRGHAMSLMDGNMTVDRARGVLERLGKSNRPAQNIKDQADLYMIVGHGKSLAGVRVSVGQYGIFNSVKYDPPKRIWSVEQAQKATAFSNWPRMLAMGDTREKAIENFKKKYDVLSINEPAAKQVDFDIYSKVGTGEFFVGKKIGRNYIDLAGPFDSAKEARAYKFDHQDALVEKLAKAKEIPRERRDTNNPRVGEDMRGGQDVTPEMFQEAFGFRGVQFGNYVEQGRRQEDLNEAYDALMDLAAVLNVSPKALSLNGELGLAFGARGSGGKGAFAAHYEPGMIVINLTKKRGAGSLGHEWWHALDNYFSRMRGKKSDMMTEAMDVSLADRKSDYEVRGAVRKEMIEAFGAVTRAIKQTALKARSRKLDDKRTKDYWTTKTEMSARAFESYLISKLHDQSASNDYLANIVDEATWKAAESLGFELDNSYPYPTAGEVPAIRAAFDEFFTAIESKETDKGVTLYQVADDAIGQPLYQPQAPTQIKQIQPYQPTLEDIREAFPWADKIEQEGNRFVVTKGKVSFSVQSVRTIKPNEIAFKLRYGRKPGPRDLIAGAYLGDGEIIISKHGDRWTLSHEFEHFLEDMGLINKMEQKILDAEIAKRSKAGTLGFRLTTPAENRAYFIQHALERRDWDRKTPIGRILQKIADFIDALVQLHHRTARGIVRDVEGGKIMDRGQGGKGKFRFPMLQAAFHGSPHRFDKFTLDAMGTGEGAQAYGWGLYFAGKKEVAEFYRESLTAKKNPVQWSVTDKPVFHPARGRWMYQAYPSRSVPGYGPSWFNTKEEAQAFADSQKGQLYKVEIPEDDVMLHWDRPLSEQPEKVREALKGGELGRARNGQFLLNAATGEEVYKHLSRELTPDADESGMNGWTVVAPIDNDKAASEYLNSLGIKGIKYLDRMSRGTGEGTHNYVIFDDSAIEVLETFYQVNDAAEGIHYQLAGMSQFRNIPKKFQPQIDFLRMKFQDKFLPLLRVQEALANDGWRMTDEANAYRAEELFHGKAGDRLEKFQEKTVAPLMEKMRDSGVTLAELEDYLYAKYAPQRNAYVASINPDMPDGGSGRSDQWAADKLAEFARAGKTQQLEALARDVRAITKMQRDIIRNEGLEADETIDAWEAANPDYVPLKGGEDATRRTIGTGFNVKGSGTKRALGRQSPATDILAHLFAQVGDTIIRAEKVKVSRAFLKMAEQNPEFDGWRVHDKLPKKRALVDKQVKDVTDMTFPMRDNVLTVTREDGSVKYVELFDDDLARVMKNLTPGQHGRVTQALASLTRFLSMVNTSLNPEFVVTNFERDLMTASIHLSGEQAQGMTKKVLKNIPSAMRGIHNHLRGDGSKDWAVWFDMFKDAGAQVSFMDLRGIDQIKKDIEAMATDKRAMAKGRGAAARLLNRIADVNTTVENAVRLSAFKNLIESGMSESDAASTAKNLTVNFNRKGELGPAMNALYMFFNAGVQGSARILFALGNPEVQKMMGLVTLMAMGLAEMNALVGGDDDDGESKWDKHVNDWTRQTNLVFMLPSGDSVKIKLPYGYNFFVALGYALSDVRRWATGDGGKNPAEAATFLFKAAMNAFNPMGDDSLLQMIAPTVMDPFVQIATNENFMGTKIAPEQAPFGPEKPNSQLYFRSASKPSKAVAEFINDVTGGDKWNPGAVDWSPEWIDHVTGFLTGGLGRTIRDTAFLPATLAEPDVDVRKVPFLRQIYQERSGRSDMNKFYENTEKIDKAAAMLKELPLSNKRAFIREHPELKLNAAADAFKKRLSLMRKAMYKKEDAGDREGARKIEEKMRRLIAQFNKKYSKVE